MKAGRNSTLLIGQGIARTFVTSLKSAATVILLVAVTACGDANAAPGQDQEDAPEAALLEVRPTQVLEIDPGATLEGDDPMPGVEGEPISRGGATQSYASGNGAFSAGLWEGTAGTVKLDNYPFHEFWRVLEGKITFTNKQGQEQSFVKGDMFVIPKGYTGIARMPGNFRKVYVSFHETGS